MPSGTGTPEFDRRKLTAPERRAREIVWAIQYVTLATVTADGRPWNSPVYSAFDADGRFYWTSAADARHSANVRTNGRVFLAI